MSVLHVDSSAEVVEAVCLCFFVRSQGISLASADLNRPFRCST